MKIVRNCEHDISANCIFSGLRQHEIPLIIVPDFAASKPGAPSKKQTSENLISKVVNKFFFTVFPRKPSRKKVREHILQKCSGESDLSNICENIQTVPAYTINSKSTADLIAKHDPDLLLVCGAPILRDRIFKIPKYGAVNFHYGYSFRYKGQHTLLWAYIRGDHRGLGGTFHKIDKGVDTGTPLSFVFPHVNKTDSLAMIEAKLAVLA
jgi:methionyl-tRNA formyltransferase